MSNEATERSGGRILVDALRIHGADMAFCVPGESYLAVLDALYDTPEIRLVTCRHESGATMMADAYGKLRGRPGIALVTRAPGATNASAGVHVAFQDSTPLILLIGQVARDVSDREAFQEVDFRAMFAPLAKWAAQIENAERIPEYLGRAFHTATSGRPGPVVLALPEDMLTDRVTVADTRPYVPVVTHPGAEDMAILRERLAQAQRPFVIVGGGGWSTSAAAQIMAFAAASDLPIGTSFRCQDYVDNTHPCYAGHVGIGVDPQLAQAIRSADLILAVGPRLGDKTTSGYTLLHAPQPEQTLIHVHSDPNEPGRVYRAEMPICSTPPAFAAALAALKPVSGAHRKTWRESLHARYLEHRRPLPNSGPVQLGEIVAWLGERLGPDAIVTNGAGNYAAWVHRHYPYRRYRSQLAPTSGSMGYGLPAAVAAKLACPERDVVGIVGDGDFQMTQQELGTAAQNRLDLVIIVINNGLYGTIRMHQEMHYPGRVKNTELVNPNFATLARAYGAHGETVTTTADFAEAFERAHAAPGPALIEIRLDPDAIAPGRSLGALAKAGQPG